MILSTQTDYLGRMFDDIQAVRILSEANFDALDYTMFGMKDDAHPLNAPDYLNYVHRLQDAAALAGRSFRQAHAPFPSMRSDDDAYNSSIFDKLTRAIEIAGLLGVQIIVIHPIHHLEYASHAEELKQINMEFYRSLAPYAKASKVRIALENMWQRNRETKQIVPSACSRTKEFINYLDTLGDDCFTACLDLGHSGLYGFDAAEMIKGLGKNRLGALHVHDNDYQSDAHTVPFLGKMHWDTICDALAQIGYTGDLTLEADNFYTPFGRELAPAAAKFLAACGRRLVDMIENSAVEK